MSAAELVKDGLIGLVATLGFAIWFSLPRETLIRASLVGMGGFIIRAALTRLGHPLAVGSFFAAVFIGVFGYYRARTFRYPRAIFTVTGIIPLVPGVSTFRAILLFSQGNLALGLEKAVQAFFVIAALGAGLTLARSFTDKRNS